MTKKNKNGGRGGYALSRVQGSALPGVGAKPQVNNEVKDYANWYGI